MDESVAGDGGDYPAGGVANSADNVAVVTVDESVPADEGGYAAGGVENAAVSVAQLPRRPIAAAVQHPRRGNRCHPSDDRC